MRNKKRGIMMALGIAALMLFGYSCGGNGEQGEAEALDAGDYRLTIVATTGMIGDIVKNVAGKNAKLHVLMGSGVDPHLYKASEGDVRRMMDADLIFYNGLHLEGAMGEVLSQMEDKAYAVTDRIDRSQLIQSAEFSGSYDPHVWFDVRLWMKAAEYVRDILAEHDPDYAQIYWDDAEMYLSSLAELHNHVYEQAKMIPDDLRVLVTAHDAFGYFGRAYGFEVHGLQGISTATEAGTADVANLANLIVDKRVPAVFVETSVPERNIRAVQEAVAAQGHTVVIGGDLFSDAMGNPGTIEGTYVGMVEHNIEIIKNSLFNRTVRQPS